MTLTAEAGGRPRRVLVVCLGNHCRSPLAAAILTSRSSGALDVHSSGIRDRWDGQPAHATMVEVASRYGYDLTGHRGRQVSPQLLAWADVVLAMDAANLAALTGLADAAKLALYLGDRDVPDPWGGDEAAFTACLRIIDDGATRHLP